MLIHAYRRREPITVDFAYISIAFKPHPENAVAIVADVTDEPAIERLLSIAEAYIEYGTEAAPVVAPPVVVTSRERELTEAEQELGFKLNPEPGDGDDGDLSISGVNGFTPEALAFAEAETKRKQEEEAEEARAIQERDKAIADAAEKAAAEAAEAAKFVLTADGQPSIDLKAMDDTALRAFAKEQKITGLNSRFKGDILRSAIVAKLVPPAAE